MYVNFIQLNIKLTSIRQLDIRLSSCPKRCEVAERTVGGVRGQTIPMLEPGLVASNAKGIVYK